MHLVASLEKLYHVKPIAFGLDISDSSIRIAKFRPVKNSLTLASFVRHPLEEGVLQNGTVVNGEKLQNALRQAMASVHGEKLRTRYVVAALPEPQAFLRVVQLPKLSPVEIFEAIRLEVETNIPLPLSDVYFDWDVLENTSRATDHLDVLVVAVPRLIVDGYLGVFHAVGLRPVALEIDALSVSRSVVARSTSPEALLLIDIAENRTTLAIFAGSTVRFTSSIGISGTRFRQAIEKELGVLPEEAEKIKMSDGLLAAKRDGRAVNALRPLLAELETQARQYIEFFQTHAAHTHLAYPDVKRIILCGDDATIPGLAAALSLGFRIPVELANPWINILKPPLHDVPILPYHESLGYATALGLALRGYQEFRE